MSKSIERFIDSGAERSLLASIIRGGKDGFIDATAFVDSNDFYLPINKAIFASIKSLAEEPNIALDIEVIKLKAKSLGLSEYITGKKESEYLEMLNEGYSDLKNIKIFAAKVRKMSVLRECYKRYNNAVKYLDSVNVAESLGKIISKAEDEVSNLDSSMEGMDKIELLTENIDSYIEDIMTKEIIDQVGIPSGFPIWDKAIGGGMRPGSVHMIVARMKTGKSFHALNVAVNVSKLKIPVLYLDTELIKQFQIPRLLGIIGNVPIKMIETREIQKYQEMSKRVLDSKILLKEMPLFYKNVSGMDIGEILAFARRWIVKNVGFNENGFANDCLIVYDYLKLTSGENLTAHSPEHILMGLIMTELHNFAVKHNIPILSYVQMNRQGLEDDDSRIVSQSDRISWLATSVTSMRNKEQTDLDVLGSQMAHGNKKLKPMLSRFGSGLANEADFINIKASLSPGVTEAEGTGLFTEGFKHSDFASGNV